MSEFRFRRVRAASSRAFCGDDPAQANEYAADIRDMIYVSRDAL